MHRADRELDAHVTFGLSSAALVSNFLDWLWDYRDAVIVEPIEQRSDAGVFLVEHGLRLVGIDSLSIDRFDSEHHPTHLVLLPKNVVVLEGLNLSEVAPGRYHMVALPLNLQNADGAPTRVILMDAP